MVNEKERKKRMDMLLDLIKRIPNNEDLQKKETLNYFMDMIEKENNLHPVHRAIFDRVISSTMPLHIQNLLNTKELTNKLIKETTKTDSECKMISEIRKAVYATIPDIDNSLPFIEFFYQRFRQFYRFWCIPCKNFLLEDIDHAYYCPDCGWEFLDDKTFNESPIWNKYEFWKDGKKPSFKRLEEKTLMAQKKVNPFQHSPHLRSDGLYIYWHRVLNEKTDSCFIFQFMDDHHVGFSYSGFKTNTNETVLKWIDRHKQERFSEEWYYKKGGWRYAIGRKFLINGVYFMDENGHITIEIEIDNDHGIKIYDYEWVGWVKVNFLDLEQTHPQPNEFNTEYNGRDEIRRRRPIDEILGLQMFEFIPFDY